MRSFSAVFILSSVILFLTSSSASSQLNTNTNKLKGVIELGADGFNSFIVKIDSNKNWSLEKSQFGKSYLMEDNQVTIEKGLRDFIIAMRQYGIKSTDIHFVVSSGAKAQKSTEKILTELQQKNYIINVVSTEKEGQLAFSSVVPDSQRNKTMVIDVGSSNTKISWYDEGVISSLSTYGSKFFKSDVADSTVYRDLQKVAMQMPENRTKTVYLIGGMPYKYAKQSRDGNERYTKLAPLDSYTPQSEKERCGAIILSELQKVGNIEEFVFDWDSNFSIGFLLDLPY